ncbi:MAG TPA: hypothetical protein VGX96_07965 [Candidatus Elarobacter sp.]|jgi:hypothetical protein|nr:hypothetical protein [Candidatus Elarobacter sp.]
MSAALRLRVVWCYLRSFFRRTWTLADYPVIVRFQGPEPNPEDLPPPMRQGTWYPYFASVYGVFVIGGGQTADEARAELAKRFEEYRAEHELPRPGTWSRSICRLAAHERVVSHGALRDEFIERILQLDPNTTFISDESSLTDFDSDVSEFDRKLRLLYNVALDALPDDRLVTVLDAIANR